MVGVAGLEPAASSSRTKHATKLRYTPLLSFYISRVCGITCGQNLFDHMYFVFLVAISGGVKGFIGVRRFANEPNIAVSRTKHATKLRYTPASKCIMSRAVMLSQNLAR